MASPSINVPLWPVSQTEIRAVSARPDLLVIPLCKRLIIAEVLQ